jgi:hypothetical protein
VTIVCSGDRIIDYNNDIVSRNKIGNYVEMVGDSSGVKAKVNLVSYNHVVSM